MIRPILPGATIGVLGSGQLGRMFAIAARRMGYRVATFSPDEDTPTGQVADLEIAADYHDLDQVRQFAQGVSAVTFEFENVPAATTAACAEFAPVRPAGEVLHTTQHRIREKTFLQAAGLPVANFRIVRTEADLEGFTGILKTAGFGYDGKGQVRVKNQQDALAAWDSIGRVEAVFEEFVDFECELSVVAARSLQGDFVHYGVVENRHANHILDLTIAPAAVPQQVADEAVEIACAVLDALDVVGVLCVEFFYTKGGKLLINELAPRPHNSGHFTFDANTTSQFEQQLRAVCGLPLGSTQQLAPAAMVNLLGDVWANGEPDWIAALADPQVKLHLYGKPEARKGRKMGHITVLGETAQDAAVKALAARARLLKAVPQ
ncbi:N5-carboxyaminoimidazole ribonucleotide synthase [Bryobacterales bacterium F-183]|nr:N5-carboxyaminoimidazole ribonucleotide synthase [Bryobacterales bacterium F-183]